jgi:MraZ protein
MTSSSGFIGNFPLTVDEKLRVNIPAKFRDILIREYGDEGLEVVITISLDKSIAVFPIRNYKNFLQELDAELASASNVVRRQFKKVFTGCAIMDTLDKQNRIRLNTFLTKYAELDREVYVIGFNDYMEIWDRKKWDEFIAHQVPKLADTLEQSSKSSTI